MTGGGGQPGEVVGLGRAEVAFGVGVRAHTPRDALGNPRREELGPDLMVSPGVRSRARGLAGVEDERWIHGVAADVVQQARELQLLVGARGPRELGALQRVLQLRHSLAAVEARRGARHGVEQPVGHRAHSRANFCSERISRGGVSLLPCAVQDTSAT